LRKTRTYSGKPAKVVALAGGTGSAKLLRGLSSLDCDLTVVTNVGDNVWSHGLYVCPDADTAMYTLAGLADRSHGWGIEGDTFSVLKQLDSLGQETWFALGDRDIATHLVRTAALREGRTLTQVTNNLCRRLGVKGRILPVTDSVVETRIKTENGEMNLQEFWVKNHGDPEVRGVRYRGASRSRITPYVERGLEQADAIVVCPANPITSVGPMLAVGGMREALAKASASVSALSPMIGKTPFSGPAGKLMKANGTSPDSLGVAGLYSDFLDTLVIDRSDREMAQGIRRLGVSCRLSDIRMHSRASERRLAMELITS
jgi:LPPG:FO 2-phospho-L-lactate transferase